MLTLSNMDNNRPTLLNTDTDKPAQNSKCILLHLLNWMRDISINSCDEPNPLYVDKQTLTKPMTNISDKHSEQVTSAMTAYGTDITLYTTARSAFIVAVEKSMWRASQSN